MCDEAGRIWTENDARTNAADELRHDGHEYAEAWKVIRAGSEKWHGLNERIIATPARTIAGIRAKATVLEKVFGEDPPLAASLVADILRTDAA